MPPVEIIASRNGGCYRDYWRNSNKSHQIGFGAMFRHENHIGNSMNANQGKFVFDFLAIRKSIIEVKR